MDEIMGLTDKQYNGMLKDQIASLDRVAKATNDPAALKALYTERCLIVSKLEADVEEHGLYDSVK